MTKYILIDTANIYFKSRHVASKMSSNEEKLGMSLHLTLSAVQSVVRRFSSNEEYHVVFCTEGRSWRKTLYPPYKANRAVKRESLTDAELELDALFWQTYESLTDYLRTKTNTSILRCPTAEADDLIARFIHLHPDDEHVIVSSDGDFDQLVKENVSKYNSMAGEFITVNGYYDDRGNEIKDKKTREHKQLGDTGYVTFEHAMRGDTADNVFSAYPRVRAKSTKKTVGLMEAYADRDSKGFNWNSMMLSRWTDHNGVEHRVLDDYLRNVTLVDLTAQPQEVKDEVDRCIREQLRTEVIPGVGIHFMKFCGRHELTKISNQAESYSKWLNSPYKGSLSVKS